LKSSKELAKLATYAAALESVQALLLLIANERPPAPGADAEEDIKEAIRLVEEAVAKSTRQPIMNDHYMRLSPLAFLSRSLAHLMPLVSAELARAVEVFEPKGNGAGYSPAQASAANHRRSEALTAWERN
jgi:hypothetical protein